MATISGGDKADAYIQRIAARMGKGVVSVGFLENATYPKAEGKQTLHVAQVAFWNNFGTSRAPARPFFSNMVRDGSPKWGSEMAAIAKANDFDTTKTLALMGEHIKDQLVKAITDWPADNADSTVQRKGFNKGLIDSTVMQRSADYTVDT